MGDPQHRHVPALDGVRGLAIVAVLVAHFGIVFTPDSRLGWAAMVGSSLGKYGVDLFFALSGYLITGILLQYKADGTSLLTFYWRRTLRIFPLYYLALAVLLAVSACVPLPAATLASQPWLWAYLGNVHLAFLSDNHWTPVVGHFWSLAVEEQFYLLWPFAVMSCSRRTLMGIALAGMIIAPAVRTAFHAHGMELAAYTLLIPRMDALLGGALLAMAMRGGANLDRLLPTARWLVPTLLAAVATTPFVVNRLHGLHWLETVVAHTLAAVALPGLIALTVLPGGWPAAQRLFTAAPLRAFGTYSYCMYIVHLPVEYFTERLGLSVWVKAQLGSALLCEALYVPAMTALVFAIGWLSWHAFEKRILRFKSLVDIRRRAAPAAAPADVDVLEGAGSPGAKP